MLINDFSGGLNTRVAPSLLGQNEAQIYTNIDNASGSIVPIKGPILEVPSINNYFTYYYAGSKWVSSNTETSYKEYRDKLYSTRIGNMPAVYDGSSTYNISITAPTTRPSLTTSNIFTVSFIGWPTSGTLPIGEYEYKIIKYTASGGVRVDPIACIFESKILTFQGHIEINIPSNGGAPSLNPPIHDVYRLSGGVYRLVGTIGQYGSIFDTAGVLTGAIDTSTNLDGTYSYVYTYYNSITGVESAPSAISAEIETSFSVNLEDIYSSADPQVNSIRLYRLGGNLTQYTLVDTLSNSYQMYIDNASDLDIAGNHILDTLGSSTAPVNLKYLTQTYAMLFGAVDDKLYYSEIGQPYSWPSTNFIDFADTITGIGPVQNGILVFTEFETHIVTGNSPETFTKYLLSSDQGCESHYTIGFTADTLIWLSKDGLCTSSGSDINILTHTKMGKLSLSGVKNAQIFDRVYYLAHSEGILCYDFRYNQLIRSLDITSNWLGMYKDTLYSKDTDGSGLSKMFAGDYLTYIYKSPLYTEGSYSNFKLFKDFYLKYSGEVNFKLFVDGVEVNNVNLSGDECYNLKALSTAKGYGLHFELTGTAEISEIQWLAIGRQNGR